MTKKYIDFIKENLPKLKEKYPNLTPQERLKKVAERWQKYKSSIEDAEKKTK